MPDSKTRQRIRQLKSEIRRKAGAQVIDADGDLLIAGSAVDCDLLEIENHLSSGRMMEAASLLLDDTADRPHATLPDEFEDWRRRFLSDVRGRVVRHASAGLQSSRTSGDWTSCRDAAEALYALDPDDEKNAARVIEARARVGRLQSAEVAYAEFKDGCSDNSSLVENAIKRVRDISDASEHDRREVSVPFVGRRRHISELTAIFARVRQGDFSFALVSGEAGIGKTKLIREVEREARLQGFRCLSAEPVELERQISMNPVIDALADVDLEPHLEAIGEPWRTVIGTMLPPGPHAEPIQALPAIEERSLSRRLLDAFSLLFRSIADEQPTIFFLDDLQWADATTIAALQFYQRRWNESFFGIVATVRPTAVGPKDPAAPYLSDDGKLDVRHIALEELEAREAKRLVEMLGDQRIRPGDVNKLCALSGFHPLYLTELTNDYLSGRLTLPQSEADAFSIPISLKQIVASRMDGATDAARSVVNALAVGSRPMRLSNLANLLELSLDRTADAAEELKQRQLVELDRDRLWIAHDLFRSAIYRELSEAHRAVLHHRLANDIKKRNGESAASELATHFDRAGQAPQSAKYGWTAAERAFERGAVAEAAHFYELVTRNETDEARRADATALLATSLHLNRDMSRANPALELASSRLRAAGMTEQARRMEIRRVEGLAEAGDTPVDELVERLGRIKEESRDAEDWEGVALALDTELQQLQLAERLDGVRALYAEFRYVLSKDDGVASAIAHQGLAVGLMLEDPPGALLSARRAVDLVENLSADRRLKALNRLLIVLLQQGAIHLEDNHRFAREAEGLAQRSGDLLQRFSYESNIGVSFMDAGELDRAEAHFDRAGALLGEADMTFSRINLAFNRGELALARRDFQSASGHFASAGRHVGLAIPKYTAQLVNAGMGLCNLEMGRVAEARRRLEQMGDPPPTWYYDPTPVLLFRARFLERRRSFDEAIELLQDAQSGLKGRMVTAWLKTQLTLATLMYKAGDRRIGATVEEGLHVASSLQMGIRQQEFRRLLEKLTDEL